VTAWLQRIYYRYFFRFRFTHFEIKPKRIGFVLVPHELANGLMKDGWTIAPEEDSNRRAGMVFLEKLEQPSFVSAGAPRE
jgi:hypothetical protein